MHNVPENFTVLVQEIKEDLNNLQKHAEVVRGYL